VLGVVLEVVEHRPGLAAHAEAQWQRDQKAGQAAGLEHAVEARACSVLAHRADPPRIPRPADEGGQAGGLLGERAVALVVGDDALGDGRERPHAGLADPSGSASVGSTAGWESSIAVAQSPMVAN